ncbi:MAG TPA: ABC transporter permease [Anaerolineaceae bacterium]|nr:ABC transporter permease [Anaerolineaceae bacterium]HPN51598.1 ABC transporter permease [Anaerolineaceae bacterium]
MSKILHIAWFDYRKRVFSKGFLIGVLSVPVAIIVVMAIAIIAMVVSEDYSPVGYVDLAGIIKNPEVGIWDGPPFVPQPKFVAYASADEAQKAMDAGAVQAYYVVSADYFTSGQVKLVQKAKFSSSNAGFFKDMLRLNMLEAYPKNVQDLMISGTDVVVQSLDGRQEMSQREWFNFIIPLMGGLLFFIVVISGGNYLMMAVVEEKENRTMEIMVTSASVDQMMIGKVLGNLPVGLTMLVIWLLLPVLVVIFGRNTFEWMQYIRISPDYILVVVATLIPALVMVAALLAMVGATVADEKTAQQISGFVSLPIMIPYYFSYQLMMDPNGPLALGLSYFPLTAPVAVAIRSSFTPIPTVQLITISAVLIVCAGLSLWLAARAFRLGMLSYGKHISLKKLFSKAG